MWTCPKCQADVEDQFESCWACGSNREGVTDPNFVREEEGAAAAGTAPARPDLVTVAAYLKPQEAHLLRSRLEAEGIEAFVEGELTSTAWGADVLGGSEVQVAEKDLARAR